MATTRSKTKPKPRKQVIAEWLASLTPEQITCRDTSIHHAWQQSTVERAEHGYNRTLVCPRCKAVKRQKLNYSGGIIPGSQVLYESGYLRPSGTGYSTKDDNAAIRLANVQRAVGPNGTGPTKRNRRRRNEQEES